MKICLISQNVSTGFLIFRKDLIIYLISQGHIVYALGVDYTDKTKQEVMNLGAIPICYKFNRAGLNPLADILDTCRLYKTLKKIKPDVVFSFFAKPTIFGTLAAKFAQIQRRIVLIEGLGYIYTSSRVGFSLKKQMLQRVHGLLCSLSYAFAHEILFLNSDDPKDLSKVAFLNDEKIRVIGPIGISLDAFPYVPAKKTINIRFIFVARLLKEKGIYEYIEAARLVRLKYPMVEFVILGNIDQENPSSLTELELKDILSENLVLYPGHVENVNEWVASSHIFVLPSYREGFPRSTQEAMAIGRAVITTDVSGCRDTVKDGLNGFLIPPWDAKALEEKMIFFVENPNEIFRMGLNSHKIATQNFDVSKINFVLTKIITG